MATAKKLLTAVQLVDIHGPTTVIVDVRINDEGDLVFSGQDLGCFRL